MVQACLDRFKRIDVLVNNVGGSAPGDPVSMPEEVWDHQIDMNLKTVFLGCKYVLPVMEAQGKGAIVNLSSVAGLRNDGHGGRVHVGYSASKAAVIQFTRSTAGAYVKKGIRCNTVVPGLMHTPLVEYRLARTVAGNDAAALIASRNARTPMGRMGTAWDVAHAVLFLASDEANYITGTEIIVDGGADPGYAVDAKGENKTMSRHDGFKELTPETMTPEQKKVADAIQSGPRGAGLRGPFNALLRSPELCDLVQRVGAYVRYSSSIPARLNEMAIIMAGRKWTAQYEFYAHRRLAIDAGLKPAICDAIAAGTRPQEMQDDEAEVYDFCTELLSPGRCRTRTISRVKSRFGERGVIDLIGAVGYYSLVSMVLNVDRVPLPAGETPPLKPI